MTSNNDIVELVGKLIDSNETDPEKLSYSILLEVSKEYTSAREEKFANEEFISAMIHLKDYSDSFKLTRNCILSIGLTCKMYHYHPNKAFNFLWSFRNNKKYIVFVSRGIWVFPQFLKQDDYGKFLVDLSRAKPEKDAIDMLYIIVSNIYTSIEDIYLNDSLIDIFEKFIQKKPDLYASKHEYLEMVRKLKARFD